VVLKTPPPSGGGFDDPPKNTKPKILLPMNKMTYLLQ
jgi:hypothetical protein